MARDRDVAAFGERAQRYDGDWRGRLHHQIADRTADLALACVPAPAKILDVGCGTGLVLADVVSRFAWGLGVDISHKMIDLARKKHIPNARFLVADAFHLTCPAATTVLSRGVLLSHYGHKQGAELLKSLRKLLLPKGLLVLDFLNRAARHRHRHVPDKKTYFTGEEVCRIALDAGFSSAKIIGRMERRVLLLIGEVNV